MSEFEATSRAKINLLLHVGQKRPDGFHEIETLFQAIDLADTLTFSVADEPRLTCDDPAIPCDARNLVSKAVTALRAEKSFPQLAIHIDKKIPAGGGLGGGSSNAAATLVAVRNHFSLAVSDARLHELAATLGSDVPFFVHAGLAYARGRGEEIFPLDDELDLPILLILPEVHVSTPLAYGQLAQLRQAASFPHGPELGIDRVRAALQEGAAALVGSFRNDLEDPVFALYPELAQWKGRLYRAGASFALMSGSGSTIFGLFENEAKRDAAAGELQRDVRVVAVNPI